MITRIKAGSQIFNRNFSTSSRILNDKIRRRPKLTDEELKVKQEENKKYAFYDLILRTPGHPKEPLEASLMSKKDLADLKSKTSNTFEGNYSIDETLTPEERIQKVFGGRIKGEAPKSSSRITRGEPRIIAGVTVPDKPNEPDNCCMSGCINCVWELFNEDIKDWNDKRQEAAIKLHEKGGIWPEDFYPPIQFLSKENVPPSLAYKLEKQPENAQGDKRTEQESWGNVPVTIRVFAEMEKKMKAKKLKQSEQKTES